MGDETTPMKVILEVHCHEDDSRIIALKMGNFARSKDMPGYLNPKCFSLFVEETDEDRKPATCD